MCTATGRKIVLDRHAPISYTTPTMTTPETILRSRETGGHYSTSQWLRHYLRDRETTLCGLVVEPFIFAADEPSAQGVRGTCKRCLRVAERISR